MSQRKLVELTREECMELLKTGVVGRVVFVDDDGPGAVPVNYGLAGDEILVRVAETSDLRTLVQAPVAFEVDRTDPEQQLGWSVLVRGHGREVPTDEVPALVARARESSPHPWAEGVHNNWLAITIASVTGRRLDEPFHAAFF